MRLLNRDEFRAAHTWERVLKESRLPMSWDFYRSVKYPDLYLQGDNYEGYVALFKLESTKLSKYLYGVESEDLVK
jgi:hypothetical protein